jgi:glucosylceramidase
MPISIFTTAYKNSQRLEKKCSIEFKTDPEAEHSLVNIHPEIRYQTFQGFGGMFTEAGGYCLKQVGEPVAEKIIEDLFGENGLQYSCGRVHLGSCDASLSNYSHVDDPHDTEMTGFSLERDRKYLIPMIKKAQAVSKRPLSLMVSPWSPPAFMKTNGERNHGGKLKPEYREFWARYICRFIKEYREAGIEFSMLTLQNEANATQTWDSCIYSAEEEREYLRNYLAPELKKQGLGHIQILIWDHNKERALERALETIKDNEMKEIVSGVAVHWYSGDHFEALDMLRKVYPDKRLVFSEGGLEWWRFEPDDHLGRAEMHAHDIIGDLNGGIDCFLQWSMIFDHNGGPNHVQNLCQTSILCNTEDGTYTKTLPYYYIAHFSRYIHPGAVRIGFSRFTDRLEVTAFMNPDKEIAVVVLNRQNEDIPYVLRNGSHTCSLTAAGHSISTITYPSIAAI